MITVWCLLGAGEWAQVYGSLPEAAHFLLTLLRFYMVSNFNVEDDTHTQFFKALLR